MGTGSLRYVDWTPGRGHPAVLDLGDLDQILGSGMLFARKIDPVRSKELLESLDSLVLGE